MENTIEDVPEKKYSETLLDQILERKEKAEQEAEAKRKEAEANDPTNVFYWDNEKIADYIVWMFQKKTDNDVDQIMNILIDKLRA